MRIPEEPQVSGLSLVNQSENLQWCWLISSCGAPPEARDRAAFIELLASSEVGTYLGGPRPREEPERDVPGMPERPRHLHR